MASARAALQRSACALESGKEDEGREGAFYFVTSRVILGRRHVLFARCDGCGPVTDMRLLAVSERCPS